MQKALCQFLCIFPLAIHDEKKMIKADQIKTIGQIIRSQLKDGHSIQNMVMS